MKRFGLALAVVALAGATAVPARSQVRPSPTAAGYLQAVVSLSPAPEYRRFGSRGIANVARYAAEQLSSNGYTVRAVDVPNTRWAPDYAPGHAPLLVRLDDNHRFKVDSAFGMGAVTGPSGVACTVRNAADVRPGDCGLVPFSASSPDFRNLTYGPGSVLDQIRSRGGIGAVVEGDAVRGLVLALRTSVRIPTIVAVARDADLLGRRVRLRVMGGFAPATLHNVVAVRRPRTGSRYVILTGHMDGWFQAASDNGTGAAAVLEAARLLAQHQPDIGIAVGLFDGEEVGLLGSKAVTAELARPNGIDLGDCGPPLHLGDIVADVNLDASSARPTDVAGGQLPVFSYRAMVFSEEGEMAATALSVFLAHGVAGLPVNARTATQINGGMTRTDARWFDAAGVPVIWPVVGYYEYHTDGDVPSIIDPKDLEAVAVASADLITKIAPLPTERVTGAPPAPPIAPFHPRPECRP